MQHLAPAKIVPGATNQSKTAEHQLGTVRASFAFVINAASRPRKTSKLCHTALPAPGHMFDEAPGSDSQAPQTAKEAAAKRSVFQRKYVVCLPSTTVDLTNQRSLAKSPGAQSNQVRRAVNVTCLLNWCVLLDGRCGPSNTDVAIAGPCRKDKAPRPHLAARKRPPFVHDDDRVVADTVCTAFFHAREAEHVALSNSDLRSEAA
ncbi:hypothetical protein FVE85_7676 [Porphyridium purpureum]|uniref:Uncharacterized protein n=1 Tax=Porphyridium purpureum TaxID=35688 RepID=A0A5J4Z7Y9_PORPP|nr:hypothetical protein FVE85_7676 [Porphyridium purpureum]|eukprot:POR0209..scf295_1